MKRSVSALVDHQPTARSAFVCSREDDPRWQLATRVVAGPHFMRSPLLSKFLLYVVRETLEGRQAEISEHRIGVLVFGRSPGYRTDEDNIVRNYARQLRKRLSEHFAAAGRSDGVRIDIPVGGYIPSFTVGADADASEATISSVWAANHSSQVEKADAARPFLVPDRSSRRRLMQWVWFGTYSIMLVAATWIGALGFGVRMRPAQHTNALWNVIFAPSRTTYVVPPDAGFNVLEDMAHSSLPLASYIKGSYLDLPAVPLDSQANEDLHTQQYSDFASMKIVATLAQLQEYDPRRVLLRFPRDLRVDDLKAANAVIIGSVSANPWAAIADSTTNFRIEPRADMQGASIVNTKPLPGEAPAYASHWNEPSHETYALILLIPNLSGNGNILIIEGLDAAGTEAAAEVLFHPDLLAPILARAERPDGDLRPFEVLLRSTSIQSDAAGTQIIATRMH